jgi:hypothetical protein
VENERPGPTARSTGLSRQGRGVHSSLGQRPSVLRHLEIGCRYTSNPISDATRLWAAGASRPFNASPARTRGVLAVTNFGAKSPRSRDGFGPDRTGVNARDGRAAQIPADSMLNTTRRHE